MSAPLHARVAFQHRDFRLFQLSRFLSVLGVQMASTAIGWQVYALTKDPLSLGYVGLSQFVPFIVFALAGGHAADRYDRRLIVLLTHLGHAISAGLLFLIAFHEVTDVRAIYGVLVLFGTARAFAAPASGALTPLLVPREHLQNAISWSSSIHQVATIAGPSLGGLLYGFGGGRLVYSASFCSALGAFVLVSWMRIRLLKRSNEEVSLRTVLAGFRFVWSQKLLLGAISMDLFAVLLGGAVALLPLFAADILHAGPVGMGFLRSGPAMGAAAMAIFLAHRPIAHNAGKKMFVAVALFGLATIGFGLSRNLALSVLCLVVLGGADMVSVLVRRTLEQLATPDEMRGRVGAVNMMFIGASNELGEFESGITAAWLGPVTAVVAGGVGTLLIVALWARLFPVLRNVDRLESIRAD